MEALFTFLGIISLVVVLIVYTSLSWGFVSYTFYNWFILTSIDGLPHFTMIQFIGFALFLNALIRGNSSYIKDEFKDKTQMYMGVLLNPWITLFFGWLIKVLMF